MPLGVALIEKKKEKKGEKGGREREKEIEKGREIMKHPSFSIGSPGSNPLAGKTSPLL